MSVEEARKYYGRLLVIWFISSVVFIGVQLFTTLGAPRVYVQGVITPEEFSPVFEKWDSSYGYALLETPDDAVFDKGGQTFIAELNQFETLALKLEDTGVSEYTLWIYGIHSTRGPVLGTVEGVKIRTGFPEENAAFMLGNYRDYTPVALEYSPEYGLVTHFESFGILKLTLVTISLIGSSILTAIFGVVLAARADD